MKQVAVGIVAHNGHVLACRRRPNGVYPLKWEFPGGKIEAGESPRQALVRELHEELAIEAEVGEEFHRQEWVYPEGGGNVAGDGSFQVFYFMVPSWKGEPINNVFSEIRWVKPSTLLTMDILEGNRDAIVKLVAHNGSAAVE